jgi:hypothetical protein
VSNGQCPVTVLWSRTRLPACRLTRLTGLLIDLPTPILAPLALGRVAASSSARLSAAIQRGRAPPAGPHVSTDTAACDVSVMSQRGDGVTTAPLTEGYPRSQPACGQQQTLLEKLKQVGF